MGLLNKITAMIWSDIPEPTPKPPEPPKLPSYGDPIANYCHGISYSSIYSTGDGNSKESGGVISEMCGAGPAELAIQEVFVKYDLDMADWITDDKSKGPICTTAICKDLSSYNKSQILSVVRSIFKSDRHVPGVPYHRLHAPFESLLNNNDPELVVMEAIFGRTSSPETRAAFYAIARQIKKNVLIHRSKVVNMDAAFSSWRKY